MDPKFKEPCMGNFGGPVNPNIALGGFEGTDYNNASTLIITFVVNNHKDKSKLGKALAWEKAFIESMKNYARDFSEDFEYYDNNTGLNKTMKLRSNLTMSFSSERSIEDELDRESDADIVTIVVSYMIMFLYITIALGQVNQCDRIMVSFCRISV